MTFHELNTLPREELIQELFSCCGSKRWVNKMAGLFPMDDLVELLEDAEEQWFSCGEEDWREAFAHHPKIGDLDSISQKFDATAQWAAGEQIGVSNASHDVIDKLQKANVEYGKKFGYIFIVSATGKTAEEILEILEQRLTNIAEVEINIAADEQNKITLIRLQKLIS